MSRSASGVISASGQFYHSRTTFNSTAKRIKPQGLNLLKVIDYSAVESYRLLSLYSSSTGQFNPYSNQVVPENFDNEVYQAGRRGVVMKLREKIKGEEWNLSTFLAELPKTLEYFGTTLNTLVRTYRAVKRGDLREVRRMRKLRPSTKRPPVTPKSLSNEAAGKWLEWRYAISPLMMDFDAALKVLHASHTRPLISRVVAGASLNHNLTRVWGNLGPSNVMLIRQQRRNLRLGMYYRVNPNVQAFKRLGLINPVATLWELVPLSFVVDWFIPIGQYLGSLDAMAGVSVWSSWESQTDYNEDIQTSASNSYMSGGVRVTEKSSMGHSTKRSYNRSANPSMAITLPTFSLSVSSKRLLDGLALTKTILLSRK